MRNRTGLAAGAFCASVALVLASGAVPAVAGTPHQVNIARIATSPYRSLATAKAAGYARFTDAKGIACIAMPPMGGMGVHFVKGPLVADPAIRLRHPEAVVFRRDAAGHLHLAALEYVVLRKDWRNAHGANAARPRLFGHRFNFTPAGNRYGLPPFYSLHAWVWYANPAGMFAMWNPRVTCSG